MSGERLGEELRAQVVAALLAGQGVTQIANAYSIPKQTVSRIKLSLGDSLGQIETEKVDRFGDLVAGCLESALSAMQAIANTVSESEYVRKQPASEVAVLYGVIADKSIRILEAAENAARSEEA